MIFLKRACALALGTSMLGLASSASGVVLTNLVDGALQPFGGFDWAQAGNAVATPFNSEGDDVTVRYWANAAALLTPNGLPLNAPNLSPANPGGTYEYTVFAEIQETVSMVSSCGVGCTNATFQLNSGTFTIYYDETPDSNLITGAGITDGIPIVSGSLNPGFAGSLTLSAPDRGTGVFALTAQVTSTDPLYVSPEIIGSNAAGTLQFGTATTNWTPPTSTPVGAIAPGEVAFQADANQALVSIPEPGTLALSWVGLLALMGVMFRRRV